MDILKFCQDKENLKYQKISLHARLLHLENPLRATMPFCENVRYGCGRLFSANIVRFGEPGWRDTPFYDTNQKLLHFPSNHRHFLRDTFFLHATNLKRSSQNPDWKGWQSVDPDHAHYRNSRYTGTDFDYVNLEILPKEITECKYSDHNHYMTSILEAEIKFI